MTKAWMPVCVCVAGIACLIGGDVSAIPSSLAPLDLNPSSKRAASDPLIDHGPPVVARKVTPPHTEAPADDDVSQQVKSYVAQFPGDDRGRTAPAARPTVKSTPLPGSDKPEKS